ncbi:MAG: hypothetical protein IT461_10880 [Planctomycetes bacterium]|nr:hypothetical protein [Planctomycetota bacterium]
MAQNGERPPWEGGRVLPGSTRPTTRYQQRAMEEQSRENQQFQGNPYTPGQGGYAQPSSYTQPFGGYAAPPVPIQGQGGVPWHGITAILVSLVCWPAGLYISSKARQSNNMNNFYMGTAGYILSALGAVAWAVRIFMAMAASRGE